MTDARVIQGDALEVLRGMTFLNVPKRDKRGWAKGIVSWRYEGWWFQSVPFTWLLPDAARFAEMYSPCVVGGPAVKLMPEYISQYAELWPDEEFTFALRLHNPDASRSTEGCRNACGFCGVSRIEGPFRELEVWEPAAYMIDSNFLQSSDAHFNAVCDRLQALPEVEFNQGVDASLFVGARAERMLALPLKRIQFSWDFSRDREAILAAVDLCCTHRFPAREIRTLRLVNNGEDPEEALRDMQELKALGTRPFAMRYQPLDALRKNDYLAPEWNSRDLKWFCRYWNRQAWLEHVEFKWPSKEPHFSVAARKRLNAAQPPLFAEVGR